MPFFNETSDSEMALKQGQTQSLVHSLADAFRDKIPVTSIEFNPPPVSSPEKQELAYWQQLSEPDAKDLKVIRSLKSKLRSIKHCNRIGSFISVTDSAAGILRLHNLTMLRLLADPEFTARWLSSEALIWEPRRTIVHLTRNHSIAWLKRFFLSLKALGFNNLLVITGDPLKEMRLKTVTAEQALALDSAEAENFRLKSSIELLKFTRALHPDFFIGVGHNPFMKQAAAEKHLSAKLEAGAEFIITQPVAYYDECWHAFADFEAFLTQQAEPIPVVLGVFNYFIPVGSQGYKQEDWDKRYKFWKKLFGFVPEGVQADYDRGLDGVEILARSINTLKRMGVFHFDVMNAEKNGWSVVMNAQRLVHELDRIEGAFDLPSRP